MPLVPANGVELFYDQTGPEGAPAVAFSNFIGMTRPVWTRPTSSGCRSGV
jgi:3-oxoadipate enol-lactonase / 4-carboxymuconolactone decarboxylase